MRVLLTNHRLRGRTGSETFTAEIAMGLREAGHDVALYTPDAGDLAETIRQRDIVVVTSPDEIREAPDVLHLQHHLPGMTALSHFPGVPALYFCHGYVPWEERPPIHPRIVRYLGPSSRFPPWFQETLGIPADRTGVVRNFVDTSRFPAPAAKPADRPRKALVYSNYIERGRALEAIRAACRRYGVELDTVGEKFGNATHSPEDLLPAYDLAFAVGRSALEAIACGCAVILCNGIQCGPLVTPANFESLYDLNFIIDENESAIEEMCVGELVRAIRPQPVAEVSQLARTRASLESTLNRLVSLYQDAIKAGCPTATAEKEIEALSSYLGSLAAHVAEADEKWRRTALGWKTTKRKRQATQEELDRAKAQLEQLRSRIRSLPLGKLVWGWLEKRSRADAQEEISEQREDSIR